MNNTNPIKKKWLVLIAALIILSLSLQDFDVSQLEKLTFKDVMPIIVLTAIIFLFKTSILSVIFISIQKGVKRLTKKD
ncbi:hypothetical protein [Virgibacillus sp. YIM 98842]|uniref:hypothetical protein n=1 Tax=Virgibacillus sp. YIM 98842 TaxID=2663533 RepID=UPI0013DC3770|nr:hypothetical protein [Virgibacillus sp. YIM 98842]